MKLSFKGEMKIAVHSRISADVTADVMKLLNGAQEALRFYKADKHGFTWKGNAEPFGPDALQIHGDNPSGDANFSLLVVDLSLSSPNHTHKDHRLGVISRGAYPLSTVSLDDTSILAYLAVRAIVLYLDDASEVRGGVRGSMTFNGPNAWEAGIRTGHLPESDSLQLNRVLKNYPELTRIADGLRSILSKIAARCADLEKTGVTVKLKPATAKASAEPISVKAGTGNPKTSSTTKTATDKSASEIKEAASSRIEGPQNDLTTPQDALGYEQYAKALAAVVTHKDTQTPLTIGISAPWGRGKTVLMRYVRNIIAGRKAIEDSKGDTSCETIKAPNRKGLSYHLCEISAWKFAKAESVWAEFYSRVIDDVQRQLPWYKRRWLVIRFLWRQWGWPFAVGIMVFSALVAFLSSNVFASWVTALAQKVTNHEELSDVVTKLAPWSGPIVVILAAIFTGLIRVSKRVFREARRFSKLPRPGDEQTILRSIEIAKWALKAFPHNRFVFFVDDIDRCGPSKTREVLEAIQLFLNMDGFVFFLAMDTKVVRYALGEHYKFLCGDDTDKMEKQAGRYLEKIVQVPFHLPELSKEQKLELAAQTLNDHLKEVIIRMGKPVKISLGTAGTAISALAPGMDAVAKSSPPDPPDDHLKSLLKSLPKFDRSRIMPAEREAIDEVLGSTEFDISPRLIKRFANVYLIARHLLIMENKENYYFVPDPSFTKWVLLSVRYPFAASKLVTQPFDSWESVLRVIKRSAPPRDEHKFELLVNGLDLEIVMKTRHITNCFNFSLN